MPAKLVKPYPEFPLTAHAKGYWVRVVHGTQHRFGKRWCKPEEALDEWYRVKDDLLAGKNPEIQMEGLTLREGLRLFLQSRMVRLKEGIIVRRSYDDYNTECKLVRDILGATLPLQAIGPSHFSHLRSKMSGAPTVISNRVGRVRVIFKYLYEAGYLDRPVRYGTEFAKPSVAVLRKHRASKPKKLFTPEQVHLLLANATPQMRGMIWLGTKLHVLRNPD